MDDAEEAAFWELVDWKGRDADSCWPWLGAVTPDTRRQVYVRYRGAVWPPRNLAYVLTHGVSVPHGQFVWLTCGHKYCLNPTHMELRSKTAQQRPLTKVR